MTVRTLQKIRVPLGFLFAALFLIFARPTWTTLAVGAGISVVGLLVRGWAAGHIVKSKHLAVEGPYAYVRNPLYLGSFFMAIGFTLGAGVWWLTVLAAIGFLGIYLPVMRIEATDLGVIFPGEFEAYEQNVPLFIPRLTPWRSGGGKFDFQLYLRYREYRAALGSLGVLAVLAIKIYFNL